MMNNRKELYRSFLIVDIEQFGRRPTEDERWLRQRMYDVLQGAVAESGFDWSACDSQDRGDSVILLVPPEVPKSLLSDVFVDRLECELRRYARRSTETVQMRMRLALHAGEVRADEHGFVGEALNTACRLADVQPARDALIDAPDAVLVLVVSDLWYRSVFRADPDLAARFPFEQIPFQAKEIDSTAWLHVLNRRPGTGPSVDPTPPARPAPLREDPRPGSQSGGIQLNGTNRVGKIVGGSEYHINYEELR